MRNSSQLGSLVGSFILFIFRFKNMFGYGAGTHPNTNESTSAGVSTPRKGDQSVNSSGSKVSSRGMSMVINPVDNANEIDKYDKQLLSVLIIFLIIRKILLIMNLTIPLLTTLK